VFPRGGLEVASYLDQRFFGLHDMGDLGYIVSSEKKYLSVQKVEVDAN
jgi:hypothetical protein